jgi:hypothetical protein
MLAYASGCQDHMRGQGWAGLADVLGMLDPLGNKCCLCPKVAPASSGALYTSPWHAGFMQEACKAEEDCTTGCACPTDKPTCAGVSGSARCKVSAPVRHC